MQRGWGQTHRTRSDKPVFDLLLRELEGRIAYDFIVNHLIMSDIVLCLLGQLRLTQEDAHSSSDECDLSKDQICRSEGEAEEQLTKAINISQSSARQLSFVVCLA